MLLLGFADVGFVADRRKQNEPSFAYPDHPHRVAFERAFYLEQNASAMSGIGTSETLRDVRVEFGMRGISDVSPRINALVGSFFERVGAAIFDLLLIPRARVPSRQRCTQRVARRSSSATPRSTRSSGRARAFMRGVRGRPQRATARERAPRRAPRPQPRWPSFWLSI